MSDYLSSAKTYLKKQNINCYDTHVKHMIKYSERYHNKDEKIIKSKISKLISKVLNKNESQLGYKSDDKELKNIPIDKLAISEIINVMLNEKTKLTLAETKEKFTNTDVSKAIDVLEEHYQKYDLWARLESYLSEVMGIGAIAILVDYDSKNNITHTMFNGGMVLPIEIIDNKIISVCLVGYDPMNTDNTVLKICQRVVEEKTEGNSEVGNGGNKLIKTEYYNVTTVVLKDNKQIGSDVVERFDVKPFVILKPFNKTYNTEYTSAFGFPIYWEFRAISEDILEAYNIMIDDLRKSRRQLIISGELLRDPITNTYVIPDYLSDSIMVIGNETSNSSMSKSYIEDISPNLRVNELIAYIDKLLQFYSVNMSLGSNTLTIEKLLAPTATQIISENQTLFNTMIKQFNQMRISFIELNRAILYMNNKVTDNKVNYNVPIQYSSADSVVEDEATLIDRAQTEYNSGLMSVYTYLSEIKGLSGEELTAELERLGYDKDGKSTSTPIQPIVEEVIEE